MFVATFAKPVRIDRQAALREAFGCESLYLPAGSSVTLSGEIYLGPQTTFNGDCVVVGPSRIEGGSVLTDVSLGRDTVVRSHSVLSHTIAGDRNLFGPFCFIRNDCRVGSDCILGAHVEAARSLFADGVKISHRAFVGDATVGARSIIGAGVVFCNFDEGTRQPAMIGADVLIGSGSLLIAPVSVGDRAVIGAGSTVTKDVAVGARLIQKRTSV